MTMAVMHLVLFLALWNFFLASEATVIPSDGQHHPRDLQEASDGYKCPGMFGAFPDPTDCSQYYVCVAGMPFRKKCSLMQNFDIRLRRCLPFLVATCGTDKDKTTAAPGVTSTSTDSVTTPDGSNFKCSSWTGSFPHSDCNKYYYCMIFIPSVKTCANHELFDANKKKCRPQKEVNCGSRRRPPGFTTTVLPSEPPTVSETQTETESTTEEITTTTVTTTTVRPTGPPAHDCNEDDLDCIITETGDVDHWFKCPQDVGAYPHPSSDKLFIFCMNWIPYAKKCGLGNVFSIELSNCVEP